MTPETNQSADAETASADTQFVLPPFRTRLRHAFRTWTTRWEFQLFVATALLFLIVLILPVFDPPNRILNRPTYPEAATSVLEDGRDVELSRLERFPQDVVELTLDMQSTHRLDEAVALPKLRALRIEAYRNGAPSLDVLKNAGKLTSLSFQGGNLRALNISVLADLKNLEHLALKSLLLDGFPPHFRPFDDLGELSRLRSVSFAGSSIDSDSLLFLKRLPDLERLNLQDTPIGNEIIPLITELPNLKTVAIHGSQITHSGKRTLARARPDLDLGSEKLFKRGLEREARRRARDGFPFLILLAFPAITLGFGLGMQLKTQFAAERARTMPGFAAPHLVVAGLLIVATIAPAAIAAWCVHGFSSVGTVSLSLLFLTMFVWQIWRMSNLLTIPMLIIWFGLLFGAHTDLIGGLIGSVFLVPEAVPVAWFLLVCELIALAALVARIHATHEEMPEYGLMIPDGFRGLTSRSLNRDMDKLQARQIARSRLAVWLMDRFFELMMNRLPQRGILRRVVLLQIVHGFGLLVLLPLMCLIPVFGTQFLPENGPPVEFALVFPMLFIPHFIMAIVGGVWLHHWKWYATDLLRPHSRHEFVRSVFYGVGTDVGQGLVWLIALQLLSYFNGVTLLGRTPEETLWLTLTCSLGFFAASTGALLHILSYRSFIRFMIGLTIPFMIYIVLSGTVASLEIDKLWYGLPTIGMVSLLIAVLLFRAARTRWLSIEFA